MPEICGRRFLETSTAARQGQITTELTEIISGVATLSRADVPINFVDATNASFGRRFFVGKNLADGFLIFRRVY